MSQQIATGRVLHVSVSSGGVPKLPVERAWVSRLGLEGDKHRENTVHGGPHRAVCLFGMEVIERLQAEGHPIMAGSAGENLTTWGIEWSTLPIGSMIQVGNELVLELSDPTNPCATQTANFSDGNFNRILIDKHSADSRMYARVVHEGEVASGDSIIVTGPAADSTAVDQQLLKRLDRAETKSMVAAWKAAREAGYQVDIIEDGEVALASSRQLPGPEFNQADGLARLPNMVPLATRFFDRHGTAGWLRLSEPPWPGAVSDYELGFYAAAPDEVTDFPAPAGITIRKVELDEVDEFSSVADDPKSSDDGDDEFPDLWPELFRRLAARHSRHMLIAEWDGKPIARASLSVHAGTGWLRSMLVDPQFRGRGLQRALIAARARMATELGCDLIGAAAVPGWVSADNIERAGMRLLETRQHYIYEPRTAAE